MYTVFRHMLESQQLSNIVIEDITEAGTVAGGVEEARPVVPPVSGRPLRQPALPEGLQRGHSLQRESDPLLLLLLVHVLPLTVPLLKVGLAPYEVWRGQGLGLGGRTEASLHRKEHLANLPSVRLSLFAMIDRVVFGSGVDVSSLLFMEMAGKLVVQTLWKGLLPAAGPTWAALAARPL